MDLFGSQARTVWTQLARQHGFFHAGPEIVTDMSSPGRLIGGVRGFRVELRAYRQKTSLDKYAPNHTYIEARALLYPPLGAGLYARPPEVTTTRIFGVESVEVGGRNDIRIGDPRIDENLEVRGDPARVVPLFNPDLRARIHYLFDRGYWVSLLDTAVSVERMVEWTDVHALYDALDSASQLAELLVKSQERARGLSSGDLGGGFSFLAYPAWAGTGNAAYVTEAFVRFPSPLQLGLFVRPTTHRDASTAAFAEQDIALNDASFDPKFVVQAWAAPEAVMNVLTPDVRKMTLDLMARVGVVHVRDDGVAVRAPMLLDPSVAHTLAREAVPLAIAISAKRP